MIAVISSHPTGGRSSEQDSSHKKSVSWSLFGDGDQEVILNAALYVVLVLASSPLFHLILAKHLALSFLCTVLWGSSLLATAQSLVIQYVLIGLGHVQHA